MFLRLLRTIFFPLDKPVIQRPLLDQCAHFSCFHHGWRKRFPICKSTPSAFSDKSVLQVGTDETKPDLKRQKSEDASFDPMHIPVSTSTSTDANPVRNKFFVDTHSNLSAGQANGEVVVNSVKVESQSCMDIVSYPPTGATADVAQTTDNCDNKNLVEKVDVLDGLPQNSVLRNLIKRARSSSVKNIELLQDCGIRFLCVLSLDR
ncbi:hypothetical protein HanLR1_Chr16g0616731 [Helianthus annuus]|nr:hypothetical protein HanLR1_Chr16g0616731 [Helianthus annuus]